MKIKSFHDAETETNKYIIEVSLQEFASIKFDEFDWKLLDECSKSTKISDALLALETIARKIEEQIKKDEK